MSSWSSCWLLVGFTALTWVSMVPAAEAATKEVEVNGAKLTYVDEGTGEPIVFVHGAVSDNRAWEPMRETISREHRFIAPTLRYFGTDEWPDKGEQFSTTTHADDIAAFIKALDAGPVHLVGWSYGADVAMAAALKNPDLVQSLILFEPAPLPSLMKEDEAGKAAGAAAGKMFDPVTAAVQEGNAEKATRLLIEGVFQMPSGGFASQPQEVQAIQLANARTMPLLWSAPPWNVTCDELKALDKPALVIHGAESNAFFSHLADVVEGCLPQAEAAVLPKVNHNGPLRDPAGLASMIEEFVAKH